MERNFFQVDSCLSSAEKLALLSFAAHEFGLKQFLSLGGATLDISAKFTLQEYSRQKTKIDLIYWDLADLSELDPTLVEKHLALLSKKGIVCVDGIGFAEKKRQIFLDRFDQVLEVPGFAIYARCDGERAISSLRYKIDFFRRKYFFEKTRRLRCQKTEHTHLVTVIILTYKHENFIAECLNSVLSQRGNFRMRVIIIDDASPDCTVQVVQKIIAGQRDDRFEIDLQVNPHNLGVVKNLAAAVRMAAGSDYLTFCEGDDFWSSDTRVQEHLDFLAANPECVMSFNSIEICSSDGSSRRIYEEHAKQSQDIFCGDKLAAFNLIGNFSACFYDGALPEIISDKLFDMYTVDWMFNLYCSQFGCIGHLRKPLSVYRQHDGGEWSNRPEWNKTVELRKLINEYNIFLDYQYDEGLQRQKKILFEMMSCNYPEKTEKFDLLIFDDVFPAPCSGFRFAEFTAYLEEFPKSKILTSGLSLPALGVDSLNDLILKFQRRYPELGNQVMASTGAFPVQLGKLLYVNFLNNAYSLLPVAEKAQVPFAFTLYPGGGFVLQNRECDRKLKRIFDSPCFRKVIVTQQITHDYIIGRGLCPIDKVEMIFGVVMPQETFADPIPKDKIRWGFGKKRLDICFMAHRYTPLGEDKGYDVFITVATRLCREHDNIYFHIVGPYDRWVIDISPMRDRIVFHGTLHPEQLDDFFKDKDIIMSPNISGKIRPGSFDGFPTASCTEGGLRGVAIFCTDEFNSASGRFTDGQDIVLINYDLDHIINSVEYYYHRPDELKAVGERGSRRIQDLYSYQSQLIPRLRILRELIEELFVFDAKKMQSLKPWSKTPAFNILNVCTISEPSPVWQCLKKYCPESLKRFYRKSVKKHLRSNNV